MSNQAQDRRVQRLVQMRDAFVGAIDRETALNQIVGADGQKIALGRKQIGRKRRRGHFDHHPDLQRAARGASRMHLLARLGQHAARLAQLLHARHERKHHAKIAVRGGAHQRAQLRSQQLAPLQRQSNRSETEAAARHFVSGRPQRIAAMLAAGQLIFVDVECANRHRRRPHIVDELPVHFVLHVLGQLVCGTSSEEELRPEEPDALGALRFRKRRVAEQIDVRLDSNLHAVGREQRPAREREPSAVSAFRRTIDRRVPLEPDTSDWTRSGGGSIDTVPSSPSTRMSVPGVIFSVASCSPTTAGTWSERARMAV